MTEILWWIIGIMVTASTALIGLNYVVIKYAISQREKVYDLRDDMIIDELGDIKTNMQKYKEEAEIAHKHIDRRIGTIFAKIKKHDDKLEKQCRAITHIKDIISHKNRKS